MCPLRDLERFHAPTYDHRSIDDFFKSKINPGIHSVSFAHHFLDLLVVDKQAKTTIVIFHAATSREVSIPVFAGRSVTKDVSANLIFLSDPILQMGANLGWFAGTADIPLQNLLPSILEHVLDSLSEHRNLAFFGPSGGGFAALFYSRFFPSSLSIPMNPQLNIATYDTAAVNAYLDAGWSGKTLRDSNLVYDLLPLLTESPNWTIYIHNLGDTSHSKRYLEPLITGTRARNKVGILLGEWGNGHKPAPVKIISDVFNETVRANGNWPELLNRLQTDRTSTTQNVQLLGQRYKAQIAQGKQ